MHWNCQWASQVVHTTMETEPRTREMTPLGHNLMLWILLIGGSLLCPPPLRNQSCWLYLFLLSTGAHNSPVVISAIHPSKPFWDMGANNMGQSMCVRKQRQIAPEGFGRCSRICEVSCTFEKHYSLRRKRVYRPILLQNIAQYPGS